jgi:hypothetical protein
VACGLLAGYSDPLGKHFYFARVLYPKCFNSILKGVFDGLLTLVDRCCDKNAPVLKPRRILREDIVLKYIALTGSEDIGRNFACFR